MNKEIAVTRGAPHQPSRALAIDPGQETVAFWYSRCCRTVASGKADIWTDQMIPMNSTAPRSGMQLITAALVFMAPSSGNKPFHLAKTALALRHSGMENLQTVRSRESEAAYIQALESMRSEIEQNKHVPFEDRLAAVMELECYEVFNAHLGDRFRSLSHQNAGMVLLENYRGNILEVPSLARIAMFIRSTYIWGCLTTVRKITLGRRCRPRYSSSPAQGGYLDDLAIDVSDLIHARRAAIAAWRTPTSTDPLHLHREGVSLLHHARKVSDRLQGWITSLPDSWHYRTVANVDAVDPALDTKRLYKGICDVYETVPTCHSYILWRILKLQVVFTMTICHHLLLPFSAGIDLPSLNELQDSAQDLLDHVCASVPFLLGNREVSSTSVDRFGRSEESLSAPSHTTDFYGNPLPPNERPSRNHAFKEGHMDYLGVFQYLTQLLCPATEEQPPSEAGVPNFFEFAHPDQFGWILGQFEYVMGLIKHP